MGIGDYVHHVVKTLRTVINRRLEISSVEKTVKVTLSCPVCKGTNIVPAKVDSGIPQSFECLECQTQFSIIKPEIMGYRLVSEKKEEVRGKKKRLLAQLINDWVLWWMLRRR